MVKNRSSFKEKSRKVSFQYASKNNTNHQIEVFSTRNEKLNFDFLIWSGLPSDFAKIAQFNLLDQYDRNIASSSRASHAAVSMVDLKDNADKGGPANLYVKNWDVLSFSDKVVLDFDAYATSRVRSNFNYHTKHFS